MEKRLITIFIYLMVCIGIQAQPPMLRNFKISDYKGGTQNWCVDFTNTDRILVANNTGLLFYDSRCWRTFPLSNYSNVRSILFDPTYNCVWAGGTNEFGCFEHNTTTYVKYRSISDRLPEKDKQFGEIWQIHKLNDKYIFQAKKHLFILHRNGSLKSIPIPFTIESSAIIDGQLLIADERGIYMVNSKQLKKLPGMELLYGKIIRAMLPYKKGQMIVCTVVDGLYLYDGKQATPFTSDLTPFLHENQLFCAAIQNDKLAIGTIRDGMVLRDLQTGQTQYANTKTGLANNTVLSLRFDNLDNVWLGLDQGIAYIMPNSPTYYLLRKDYSIGTGYASHVFRNRLYLGTNQGLYSIPYPLPNTSTPPTPQLVSNMVGQVWNLTEINGTLLCGCDAGAFIIKGEQGVKIKGPEGTLQFLPLRHHPEYILGCDYWGLYLLHAADFSFAGRIKGFENNSGIIFEDTDGSIWLSHWHKGVYRLTLSHDCKKITKSVRFGKGNGLLLDQENLLAQINGRILISSVDGFHHYNQATGKLEPDETMNKVFDTHGTTLHLFETPAHDIWAYNPHFMAIARRMTDGSYAIDTLTYKNIRQELNLGLNAPFFLEDRDQTILNSLNGFIIADNKATVKPYNARLKIDMIETTNHGDSMIYACGTDTIAATVKIKHNDKSLRISFTMPEYMNVGETVYSCILEDYDPNWSDWQTDNTRYYTQLPKGKYIFRVKARNKLTNFEDEQSITLIILPAWYETWWAYTIYLLLTVWIIWMLAKWAKRRQERNLNELRAQKEQEMHQKQTEFELEQRKKENELARLKNEQLETELKHRHSELGDTTMNLMRKNDMLQVLDAQLDELSEKVRSEVAKSKITQKIKEIRNEIRNNINEDEGWDKFEENFNLVYENFMKRLTARFPDLKMNDRKLCAYLRMGFSSKEMASLLNTSVRSIETARYRLRKKLGMEQGDNLTEFIQSFSEQEDNEVAPIKVKKTDGNKE